MVRKFSAKSILSQSDRAATEPRPQSGLYNTEQDITEQNNTKGEGDVGSSPTHPLVEVWNKHCGKLPKVKACGASRLRFASLRWKENPSQDYWAEVVKKLSSSQFCTGANNRGWRANFDFLLRPETQHKVLEGVYDGGLDFGKSTKNSLLETLRGKGDS